MMLLMIAGVASAELTFTVGGSWPNDAHRNAAVNAMQRVVDRYNAYGFFGNHDVYAYYNAGIPTAQASYLGSIGFGGTYPAERVTQHEMAHYLGLPSNGWSSLLSSGSWSGTTASQLVQQFEGDGETLRGDSIHFWPYGLNYDSEGSEINKQRQVAMVYAMRNDLGIGSRRHPSSARQVYLTADDPTGQSGFNYQERWSDGYFAHSYVDYYAEDHILRTPANSNSFTFAGESLTLNGASMESGLYYVGTGDESVITVDDLILDGGWLQHFSGLEDAFRLDGAVTVVSESNLRAKQGDIELLAPLHGDATLNIHRTDSSRQHLRFVRLLADDNSFTGDLINNARFELAEDAGFRFLIGDSGQSNQILGESALATWINGVFHLDLSAAGRTPGDAWQIVSTASVAYGSTFRVEGFSLSDEIWSNGDYEFDPATGVLTYVVQSSLSGDYNGDGRVDASDYTVWRDNLNGVEADVLAGNGNGDGVVDNADYVLWHANYGASAPGPTRSLAPEPSAACGVLLALLAAIVAGRRSGASPAW